MSDELDPLTEALGRELHWVGVFMIAVGLLAFLFVGIASMMVELLVGASFMMTGLAGIIATLALRHTRVFAGAGILAALSLGFGIFLLLNPTEGLITLTVLICSVLLIEGAFQFALALDLRPRRGWAWMLTSSLISIVAGLLVLVGLPNSSRIVLGALLGLSFLSTGIAFITSAENIKRL